MQASERHKNIPWHFILIFLLLTLGIGITGYYFYRSEKEQIKRDKQHDLLAIADLKINQIKSWREERFRDASFIFRNRRIADQIHRLLKNPASSEMKREILGWMESMYENRQYSSMCLITSKGNVLLSLREDVSTTHKHVDAHLTEALRAKRILFSDLYQDTRRNIFIDIVVPILIHQKSEPYPVGAVLLRIDPHAFLYPLIQSWPVPSLSAETLIFRLEGNEIVFLNELRHKKDTAFTLRFPVSEEQLPAAMALRGTLGVVEGTDYRGVKVLAAVRAVPDSPWFLVAKVDEKEVFAPHLMRFRLITFMTWLLIAAAGLSIGFLWRHQQAQFYRKQYETEQHRLELLQKYEHLTRYANDIILLMDYEGRIVEANAQAVRSYGYDREELLRLKIWDLRAPETRSDISGQMREVEEHNGLVFETLHQRKDNSLFPVEVSSRVIEIDGNKFYQGIIRDITDRKKAERTLEASETKFRQLFENMSSGVAVYEATEDGSDFLFRDINAAGERITGVNRDNLIGRKVLKIFPGVKELGLFDVFQRVWKTGNPEHHATSLYKDAHVSIWVDNHVYKLPTGEIVAVFDNVTEQKQAEEALKNAYEEMEEKVRERTRELSDANIRLQELDRLKSMFIASMSHELRTPLNSIIGFTGIILQGLAGPLSVEQKNQLTIVKNSASHLLSLINDIIDLSKIEAGKVELVFENFDIAQAVHEVYESFYAIAFRKKLAFTIEIPKNLFIRSDKRRIKQVVMNLMSNAIKFTDEGEIKITMAAKEGKAEISVIDTGIGIRQEDMEKLFRAFSRIHVEGRSLQEGTGLGLYLSKKIAGLLGGHIRAESEIGKGSIFTFLLPLEYKEEKT